MTTAFSASSSAAAPGNSSNVNWTLSNGNLTASRTPGGSTGIDTTTGGLSSGKWYWEMVVVAVGSGASIGIIKSGDGINAYLGFTANAYAYDSGTGNKLNNNGTAAYGSSYTTGDVIGVAYDAGAGNLWFSKNGTWQASATIAEIAAGTTTHAAFAGLSGTFYPGLSCTSGSGGAVTGTVRVNSSTLTGAPPSGYLPLDVNPYSLVASPLSYALSLIATNLRYGYRMVAAPLSYALTLRTAIVGRLYRVLASPLSFALTLVTTTIVNVVAAASKFKRRVTAPALQKLRTTDPTLED